MSVSSQANKGEAFGPFAEIYEYPDRGFDARNARQKLDIESFGVLACRYRFWCESPIDNVCPM